MVNNFFSKKQAEQKAGNSFLVFIAVTASVGGFLFGYDTAVVSGTIGLVKAQFELDAIMEGWFVSSALVGCIGGVLVAGELSDRIGRKKTLILSGFLFSLSALGCMIPETHSELVFYRILGGIGVGIASILSPLYISEVSPAHLRGRMVALYQLAIAVGILSAYFTNAWLLDLGDSTDIQQGFLHEIFVEEVWRSMFGLESIPAILFFLTLFFIPESPRWLSSKDRNQEAKIILERIEGNVIADEDIRSIKSAIAKEEKGTWNILFHPGIRVAMFVGILLAILSQFTGINAIIYYGPRILEEAGLKLSEALGGQVFIGFINVVATIFTIWKIDSFGRKKLLLAGVSGMALSLTTIGILFLFNLTSGSLVLIFILVFCASFSIGFGPVVWVLLSEIYPTNVRGRAMSLATFSLWIGTAVIGQVVPWMLETLGASWTFFVFAICCIPVPFILKKIPETKGMSLEDIESVWQKDE
ncbi:sugar porter family MFS transporter [Seonamhaeicola sediminis]|uniref:Sugar porter (SP) family MFS transporter n=2 Tax=Seonamhaeicola TaxID=1649495 RepID=A0A3D9HDF1_9FLAO|nr:MULTISPECIES: sugar porter family MFS transporter [Seonamhaeicola]RED47490.1 sugar porter (SP) family MFS transporter [Seonamhaeicola aphaedonensis]TWO34661.1 sugar porter family MFS transporter [Seonamhaeicola sediminis]